MANLGRKVGEIGEWLGSGTLNFFGRQFAGKDLQAERLGIYFGVKKISGGDIMRESVVPEEVRAIIDSGELSPTDIYKATVLPYLGQVAFKGKPLLLSAVGRMSGEEPAVIETAAEAGHLIMAVPYLDITEDESFRRLAFSPSRGRADDTPEGLRKRLDEFNNSTSLVLNTYEDMGLLVNVDAMQAEDIVFSTLVHLLHERASA
ncbi:MAG TPA: nucleoside monophosphate kinase [Candidatus Saccharimonadales bacterium]|nr:nucleoside monophosphate kinase [Candidatus Saccharimonadales bacterium]